VQTLCCALVVGADVSIGGYWRLKHKKVADIFSMTRFCCMCISDGKRRIVCAKEVGVYGYG